MLIIRRKPGETVLIGENIELRVIDVSAGRVKLGFVAPSEVLILRSEIRLAQQQNLAAARGLSSEAVRDVVRRLLPASSKQDSRTEPPLR